MNRFTTLTQPGILVMYIPTIFMGRDANEETPEKNSMDYMDWVGECPQSTGYRFLTPFSGMDRSDLQRTWVFPRG